MIVEAWENIIETRLKTDESILNKDLSPAIDDLNAAVNDLKNFWKGSDYDNFEKKISPFLKDIDDLEASIISFQKYIQGYLSAYQSLISHYETKNIVLK